MLTSVKHIAGISLALLGLLGCSNGSQEYQGGTRRALAQKTAEQVVAQAPAAAPVAAAPAPTAAPDTPEPEAPAPAPTQTVAVQPQLSPPVHQDDEMPPEAVSPVVVGGAFLVCKRIDQVSVQCESFARDGSKVSFAANKAYYVDNTDFLWKPVEYTLANPNILNAKIPAGVKGSVAIVAQNAEGGIIADWAIDAADPVPGNVKDPGFESYTWDYGSHQNNYVRQGRDATIWTIRNMDPNNCPEVELEVFTNQPVYGNASEGRNWVELDGACNSRYGIGNNNDIYQYLSLKKEHFYEVLFDYKKRPEGFGKMDVNWDAASILTLTDAKTDWQTARVVVKANKESLKLIFASISENPTGIGPQLDNVRVYDLGAGP